jgi:hypothetical protein
LECATVPQKQTSNHHQPGKQRESSSRTCVGYDRVIQRQPVLRDIAPLISELNAGIHFLPSRNSVVLQLVSE